MQNTLKENPMIAAGIGLLAISLFMKWQSGDFAKQAQAGADIQQARLISEKNLRLLEVSQEATNGQAPIAEQRYKSGCVMVFSSDPAKPNHFTALSQGQPVLDGSRKGAVVPDNTIVCDALGNTAKISNGVTADFAFTPNRQVVADAMQRYNGSPQGSTRFAAPRM